MPYLTPEELPDGDACRPLYIPDSREFLAIVSGALTELVKPYNWQEFGALTVDETVASMQLMIDRYFVGACVSDSVPTPFWDEAQDLDDEAPVDDQDWYGEVTDENAAADALTWQENASIWIITGFIAYSGQIGAALFFRTIAPRFVHAFHKGDVREVWRVVVDAADYGYIDTDDYPEDAVIDMPIVTDPDLETHDIYIIKME